MLKSRTRANPAEHKVVILRGPIIMLAALAACSLAFGGPGASGVQASALLRAPGPLARPAPAARAASAMLAAEPTSGGVSRRALAAGAASAALLASPLAALADGASTAMYRQKAFTVYGARILAVSNEIKPNSALIADTLGREENAFTLFISSEPRAGHLPACNPHALAWGCEG